MDNNIPRPTPLPDHTPTDKKQNMLNILAIMGFLAALVLVAFLAVTAVSYLPNAFSSLANLAESLRDGRNDQTITLTTDKETLVDGEEVTVSWEKVPQTGTYTFMYECIDGVDMEIRKDNSVRAVRCDTTYSVGEDTSIRLYVDTSAQEEVRVPFTVTFLRTNDTTARATGNETITVAKTEVVVPPKVEEEIAVDTPPPTVPPPTPPVSPAPQPVTPTVRYVSYYPQSNPSGYTDLAVRFVGVGTVGRSTGFARANGIVRGTENAVQIEVKNIGTKTSTEWDMSVELPDGSTYEADKIKELKPNERVTYTLLFTVERSERPEALRAKVEVTGDRIDLNDRFSTQLSVTR